MDNKQEEDRQEALATKPWQAVVGSGGHTWAAATAHKRAGRMCRYLWICTPWWTTNNQIKTVAPLRHYLVCFDVKNTQINKYFFFCILCSIRIYFWKLFSVYFCCPSEPQCWTLLLHITYGWVCVCVDVRWGQQRKLLRYLCNRHRWRRHRRTVPATISFIPANAHKPAARPIDHFIKSKCLFCNKYRHKCSA